VWGVGLSHEIFNIAGAEPVINVEGNMCGAAVRGALLALSRALRVRRCCSANDNAFRDIDGVMETIKLRDVEPRSG